MSDEMASIERITLNHNSHDSFHGHLLSEELAMPGLMIGVRATTSSLSDYASLNLDEVLTSPLDRIITDGVCS